MSPAKSKIIEKYVDNLEGAERVISLRLKRSTFMKLQTIVKRERKTTVGKFLRAMVEKFVQEYENS